MDYTCALAALVLVLASSSSADNTYTTLPESEMWYCPYLNPDPTVNLDEILGTWYVVEILKHKVDALNPTRSGRVVVEVCPVVQIRSISRTILGLLWTEKLGTLDYTLSVTNPFNNSGYWIAEVPQNGTLLNRNYVQQFVGTVQVIRAVSSHMVLTFCSKTSDNQIYSVLLSREYDLPVNDRTAVEHLLSRGRLLTLASVKETCANAGSSKEDRNVTRWMTVLLIAVTVAVLGAIPTTTLTTTGQLRYAK